MRALFTLLCLQMITFGLCRAVSAETLVVRPVYLDPSTGASLRVLSMREIGLIDQVMVYVVLPDGSITTRLSARADAYSREN